MTRKVSKQLSSFFDVPIARWPTGVKSRLRDMADELWSLAVREDWNHRCAVCGSGRVESHHLIPRQHYATRYELLNGIALCSHCHQFSPDHAPHQNAAGWLNWLLTHHTSIWQWLMDTTNNGHDFHGTKNATYFCDVIRELGQYVSDEDYRRIVGVRFAEYLEATE